MANPEFVQLQVMLCAVLGIEAVIGGAVAYLMRPHTVLAWICLVLGALDVVSGFIVVLVWQNLLIGIVFMALAFAAIFGLCSIKEATCSPA